MISVKAIVKGEPDTRPFTMDFQYRSKSDEIIFSTSVQMISEKLTRNLKINTHESLVLYCDYIVDAIRRGKSDEKIQDDVRGILSANIVMIGVPETLRLITVDALVDNLPRRQITLNRPIVENLRFVKPLP
jgi:urease subunit gamma